MDIIKTGEFIAKLRKDKGLTQEQFGDKMGVTNKTVSRWETGKYLPPADILLLMSELFDVSINELLAGQRLSDDEYKQTADNNLTEALRSSSFTTKDKIDFFKKTDVIHSPFRKKGCNRSFTEYIRSDKKFISAICDRIYDVPFFAQ